MREILRIRQVAVRYSDLVNSCHDRSGTALFQHQTNVLRIPGEYRFKRVVTAIAHPAPKLQGAGFLNRPPTKPNALHAATENHVNGAFGHQLFEFHDDLVNGQ